MTTAVDVLLVSMPFGPLMSPSLALSLLQCGLGAVAQVQHRPRVGPDDDAVAVVIAELLDVPAG